MPRILPSFLSPQFLGRTAFLVPRPRDVGTGLEAYRPGAGMHAQMPPNPFSPNPTPAASASDLNLAGPRPHEDGDEEGDGYSYGYGGVEEGDERGAGGQHAKYESLDIGAASYFAFASHHSFSYRITLRRRYYIPYTPCIPGSFEWWRWEWWKTLLLNFRPRLAFSKTNTFEEHRCPRADPDAYDPIQISYILLAAASLASSWMLGQVLLPSLRCSLPGPRCLTVGEDQRCDNPTLPAAGCVRGTLPVAIILVDPPHVPTLRSRGPYLWSYSLPHHSKYQTKTFESSAPLPIPASLPDISWRGYIAIGCCDFRAQTNLPPYLLRLRLPL
ncbi:hypothetical protein B0H16DRAFT_1468513 [Mycena metata]|uniref:Uncharacterized protein n=1 Tax=Mycena metata TaxID=1033252 RepID=A0AAD7MUC5_9AGAR|nr:hypothetical protein B0H16DRAFT_1468513 [Mycena metata]